MPKLHKKVNKTKFRPVIDICGSLLSYFSKWLSIHLQSLLKFLLPQVKDSQPIIENLLKLRKLPWFTGLFTCDALAMYTNIDLDNALQNIENWLRLFVHKLPN